MSGLPINTLQQAQEYRKRYLANLALESQLDAYKLNANQVYRQTGQPIRPPDMRSTTEKLGDIERLKIDLRSQLNKITDQAGEVISSLTTDEIIFANQQIARIISELSTKFSLGAPAKAIINYIKQLQKKELTTSGVSFEAQEATSQQILNAIQNGINMFGQQATPFQPPSFQPEPPSFQPEPPSFQPDEMTTRTEKSLPNLTELVPYMDMSIEQASKEESLDQDEEEAINILTDLRNKIVTGQELDDTDEEMINEFTDLVSQLIEQESTKQFEEQKFFDYDEAISVLTSVIDDASYQFDDLNDDEKAGVELLTELKDKVVGQEELTQDEQEAIQEISKIVRPSMVDILKEQPNLKPIGKPKPVRLSSESTESVRPSMVDILKEKPTLKPVRLSSETTEEFEPETPQTVLSQIRKSPDIVNFDEFINPKIENLLTLSDQELVDTIKQLNRNSDILGKYKDFKDDTYALEFIKKYIKLNNQYPSIRLDMPRGYHLSKNFDVLKQNTLNAISKRSVKPPPSKYTKKEIDAMTTNPVLAMALERRKRIQPEEEEEDEFGGFGVRSKLKKFAMLKKQKQQHQKQQHQQKIIPSQMRKPIQLNLRNRFQVPPVESDRKIQGFGLSKIKNNIIVDNEQGIKITATHVPFGKYFIDINKLSMGILELKSKNGLPVMKYKKAKILTKKLNKILKQIVGGQIVESDEYRELDNEDQEYIWNLAKDSHIMHRLNIPTPVRDRQSEEQNRFEILKGQILSGNDNKELIKEFKVLLLKLCGENKINKNEARELLLDITSLGY